MKKVILIAGFITCIALQTFAQGQFAFSNYGLDAPIYLYSPTSGMTIDNTYSVDYIYAELGGVTDESQLTFGLATPKAALAGGLFAGGTQTIAGYVGTISLEIRAWKTSAGSYANAVASGAPFGRSSIMDVALSDSSAEPPRPAASLMGAFTSFGVGVAIPEPSTLALGALGMSVLLFRRR